MSTIYNSVVDNVLCYISTARHLQSDEHLISVCKAFYASDKITAAKEVLYKQSGEVMTKRRGDCKMRSDLVDMLSLFRRLDEEGKVLPNFLCDGYSKMPPASGFEIIAEHIVGLMTEIGTLRSEINEMKNINNSFDADSLNEVKAEVNEIRKIVEIMKNDKKEEKQLHEKNTLNTQDEESDMSYAKILKSMSGLNVFPKTNNISTKFKKNVNSSGGDNSRNSVNNHKGVFASDSSKTNKSVLSSNHSAKYEDQDGNNEKWQTVKKKRPAIKGSRKSIGHLHGVQETRDLYVGRCDQSTTVEGLINYIKNEVEIDVITCVCISNDSANVKSFKVGVKLNEIDGLLNADLWPENIRVRKFYNRRNGGRN